MSCLTVERRASASDVSVQGMASGETIYGEYQAGATIEALAQRFRRAPADIARLVERMRAKQIREAPLSYVPLAQFSRIYADPALEAAVLGPPPADDSSPPLSAPRSMPAYLASLYEVPLLTRSQEFHLFRKMNYLKYKAHRLREKLDPRRPSSTRMEKIEACHQEALVVRNQLVRANLRLVVSVAKRHFGSRNNFFELVSDGNVTLLRAVENFDFSWGNRFSTYAVEALKNTFARNIPAEYRRHRRFRTACDEALLVATDERLDPSVQEKTDVQRQSEVSRILKRLEPRDRQVIIRRFGLQRGCEPLNLRQIGVEMGVTKERVRQIESRAMEKLRGLIFEEKIDIPV